MALSKFYYYRLYHLIRLLKGMNSFLLGFLACGSAMSGHTSYLEVQCSWICGALPSIEVELDTVHY